MRYLWDNCFNVLFKKFISNLWMMHYDKQDTARAPADPKERTVWTFGQKATIELTQ